MELKLKLPIKIRPTINNDGYVIVDNENSEFFFYNKSKETDEMDYDGCCINVKKNNSKMKNPNDYLNRGKESYINCVDYDDAVEAIKKYSKDIINGIVTNLNHQLSEIESEHIEEINKDTYWRGVKIGLETANNILKDKLNYQN